MLKQLFRWLTTSNWLAWVALVALLPVTSMPLVARLAGSDSVAAASALPLLWLVVFWLAPFFLGRGRLPRVSTGLLPLLVVIVLSTLLAAFLALPTFKTTDPLRRDLVSLLTLGVGVGFYLVSSTWPRDEAKLRFTLQVVNWSGLVMVVWALAQGFFWFTRDSIPQFMEQVQSIFSLQGFYFHRANGFAYEPSWFAHQLNMVYLPLWLASTIQRYSAHRFRLIGFSFENLLLAAGLAAFLLSASRVGLLAFLMVIAYLTFAGTRALIRRIQVASARRRSNQRAAGIAFKVFFPAALAGIFIITYLGAAVGLVYGVSRYDPRLARLFDPSALAHDPYEFANQLQFAERVVFWATGWNVFNDHPILGVGLGNTGYYFVDNLPGYAWKLTEVNTVLFRGDAIPNTKSLWSRLLSETGIIGFILWIGWLYLLWQASRLLRSARSTLLRTLGWSGSLVLVGLLAEGFSVDSLALPYYWFSFGLLSAASQVAVRARRPMNQLKPTN